MLNQLLTRCSMRVCLHHIRLVDLCLIFHKGPHERHEPLEAEQNAIVQPNHLYTQPSRPRALSLLLPPPPSPILHDDQLCGPRPVSPGGEVFDFPDPTSSDFDSDPEPIARTQPHSTQRTRNRAPQALSRLVQSPQIRRTRVPRPRISKPQSALDVWKFYRSENKVNYCIFCEWVTVLYSFNTMIVNFVQAY